MDRYLLISIMLASIILTGCLESESLSNEEQRFVGTWIMEGMETTITFFSNGDVSHFFGDKFEIRDKKFVILTRFSGGFTQELYDYNFSDNDSRLVLINIDTEITHNLIKK